MTPEEITNEVFALLQEQKSIQHEINVAHARANKRVPEIINRLNELQQLNMELNEKI